MMNDREYFYKETLELRLRAAEKKIAEYESEERYVKMQEHSQKTIREMQREIDHLHAEMEAEHRQHLRMIDRWLEVCNDVQQECDRKVQLAKNEASYWHDIAISTERALADMKQKFIEAKGQNYKLQAELSDREDMVKKLQAQINKDFETSSIPSSLQIGRKKIPNSREKTGRNRGG